MSLQTLLTELRAPGATRMRLGAGVLALVLFTLVVAAWQVIPVINLAGRAAPPALRAPTAPDRAQRQAAFAQRNTLGQQRVIDRWPFYPPPPKVVIKPSEPVPLRYGGPSLIAMINGAAWFNDGTKLKPGDAAVNDLEVLELRPPWTAKVRWQGGEFTVTLFEREPVNLSSSPVGRYGSALPSSAPASSPAAPNPGSDTHLAQPASAPAAGPASPVVIRGLTPMLPGGVPGAPRMIMLPDGRTGFMQVIQSPEGTPGAPMVIQVDVDPSAAPAAQTPPGSPATPATPVIITPGAPVAPATPLTPSSPSGGGH